MAQAAQIVSDAAKRAGRHAIGLVAVPYMGDVGKRVCMDAGVGFVDLSGNAMIEAPGLRVNIAGLPNQFVRRGRPSSVFALKSSRVSRLLLLDPQRWWRQGELAAEVRLEPDTSAASARWEQDVLIERNPDGAMRPKEPQLLLDAWKGEYDFRDHDIREGHVTAKTGEELAKRVMDACKSLGYSSTLTGLAAAWLLAPFAGYRLVAVYINKLASERLLQRLKWHEEKRGANLWLVRPNDEGVFHGAKSINGISCVSPVQAFLDLQAMPERSQEAAEQLRKERMQWR
ncbi:MAG: hypothetical protein IPM18_00080 [Phycisphaerales bacterium]|nr:hypothetical protein [Phycisphaerales bacterium]